MVGHSPPMVPTQKVKNRLDSSIKSQRFPSDIYWVKKEKAIKPKKAVKSTKPAKPRKKKDMPELCMTRDCTPETRKFSGLCRKCYLFNWKGLKSVEQEKAQRRLNAYVERITKKYPEDYIERIRDGLENEDIFNKMVAELELEQESESETEREFLEKFSRKIRNED